MANEKVDVVIIGSGASGAAAAWSLADTRMRILCLEQGGHVHQDDYPSNGMDWEWRTGVGDFCVNPNMRMNQWDYPINDTETPIKPAMFNAVGGSTILWTAHFPRFRPNDFKVRTVAGVADNWPLEYSDLEPFFATNDRIMGVSGLPGDPSYPPKTMPLPPLPLGHLGHKVASGFNELGWHWWPSDTAILSRPYEGRAACINTGPCLSGCPQGAKASTDITYLPEAQRKGVEVRSHCRVSEITVREDGMADGVLYYDADGELQEQKAEVIIMACNGIGTPRILLNSKSKYFPDGLANSSGLVGKNLMLHPYGQTTGIFDEPLDSYKGPIGCALWSHEFYDHDPKRDFDLGYSLETTRGAGPAITALTGMGMQKLSWGVGHHEAYRKLWNRTASLISICEDLPEEHNCVTLDPELTDSNGIPAPRIQYSLSENSRRMLAHGHERAKQALEAAGAVDTFHDAPVAAAGWHLMGTARMGTDPAKSVVNEWGRAHDVKNLFIVDGSIFVTSAGVNPCSTIQALALYIADQIKSNLSNLFD